MRSTAADRESEQGLAGLFEASPLSIKDRLAAFPRHVRRQDVARFIARTRLFEEILEVNGSIVECGVFSGAGVFSWLHLSSIFEPYNYTRRIIGFDTFDGFRAATLEKQ